MSGGSKPSDSCDHGSSFMRCGVELRSTSLLSFLRRCCDERVSMTLLIGGCRT